MLIVLKLKKYKNENHSEPFLWLSFKLWIKGFENINVVWNKIIVWNIH